MSKQSKDIDRLYKFFDWDTLQHIKPRDSHKSFYSKARQVSNEAGELLISYDTPVAFKFADSGNIIRLWDKWSATTGRHLRAWHGIDKAQWMSMQVHPIDALCNTLEHIIPNYIIGEEVLYEMMDGIEAWEENWNNKADDETNAAILAELDA